MNRTPTDDYFSNPARYRRLAEQERARATRALAAQAWAALAGLGRRFALRLHFRPLRWTERLG